VSHKTQRGAYGGGFLELLITGEDPTPSRYGASPSAVIVPMAGPEPSYDPGRAQLASYAPEMEERGVRRTVDPIYFRQEVDYQGSERPGTVVIDTPNKFLFLVQTGGRALRYGIGVGRPGFEWSGVKTISRKAEWPDWTPPSEMLRRRPDLPHHMVGGPENPLGARALYLGSSLYRIHGTNEPYTIGTNVSSGCIRMMNDDVVDLYGRVGVGTKVIVM
jgi:lipoprotein-anchoring transpeptidase ErfK/SrfK